MVARSYKMGYKILFDIFKVRENMSFGEILDLVCSKGSIEQEITKKIIYELISNGGKLSRSEMAALKTKYHWKKPSFYLTLDKLLKRGMILEDMENNEYVLSLGFSRALRMIAKAWENFYFEVRK